MKSLHLQSFIGIRNISCYFILAVFYSSHQTFDSVVCKIIVFLTEQRHCHMHVIFLFFLLVNVIICESISNVAKILEIVTLDYQFANECFSKLSSTLSFANFAADTLQTCPVVVLYDRKQEPFHHCFRIRYPVRMNDDDCDHELYTQVGFIFLVKVVV